MTTKTDRTARPITKSSLTTGRTLEGETFGRSIQSKINYLRNWRYYQPIVQCAGLQVPALGATEVGKIYPIYRNATKRDTANSERYFAVIADDFQYYDGADPLQWLNWYQSVGAGTFDYMILRSLPSSSDQTGDYTAPPDYENLSIFTGGMREPARTQWNPLITDFSSEFDYNLITYTGMSFRGLAVMEIPHPNQTQEGAGCALEEMSKDNVIRGDISPTRNLDTWGSIIDLIGDGTDGADSVEFHTRQRWQWAHPFGVYAGTAWGGISSTWYNILSPGTVKFKPRKIFDDQKKVRVTIAAVITADSSTEIRITNNTTGDTYTHQVSSLLSVPTLVVMSAETTDLRAARGIQNHFEFEFRFIGSSNAIKVHSLAIFEEDPFDAID